MTTQEMNEVWNLIGAYRQGDKRFGDKGLLKAWYAALRVYDVDAVKNAVVEHFRNSSFFPDVSEVVTRLPRKVECDRRGCDDAGSAEQMRLASIGPVERECMDESKKWQMKWHEELHALGLPTMREALESGMTLAQWNALLTEAGVWA